MDRNRMFWMTVAVSAILSVNAFGMESGFSIKDDPGIVTPKDLRLTLPDDWGSVSFFGRDRARYEAWDYFASATDNDYEFGANQLRIGSRWVHNLFNVNATWQYTHLSNLPTTTSAGAGSGSLYFSNSRDRNSHGQTIKYLNLELKQFRELLPLEWLVGDLKWYRGLLGTVGRFNYSSGNELVADDKKIAWLKGQRIGDRLIGGFEWSHYGRSFDGAKLSRTDDVTHLSIAGFHPTQGGFEERANRDIDDIDIIALEATVKKDKLIPGMEENLFYYNYNDHRNIAAGAARLDNTGRSITAGTESDIELHTFGGHAVGTYAVGSGTWDVLGWTAWQKGNWFDQEQSSFAYALETGYQLTDAPWSPWVRFGYNYGSGDADPTDNVHETFDPMLPTARLYSYSILYNQMNNEDMFVSLILKPDFAVTVRTEYHMIDLAEQADRWYLGSGTIHNNVADDFAARTSNGQDDLGNLLDTTVTWQVNPDLTLMFYYGHFFGNEVVERFFTQQNDANFAYLEMTLNF